MSEQLHIEPLGDHEYLLRARETRGTVVSRFQANPSVLEELHVPEAEEQRVVNETAAFLAERQPLIDLPQMVDLEDVAAAYSDYVDVLSRRLTDR
ncbi:hypothetical protein NGB36_26035 [Streptomyces sp. RB6PN25]|uniref:Uncharacterized protein n=1 Tax=Streptomyces humicola TaxID=2953240 RepID=A0ABT1Q1Z6_9ACTN|nr:hypothetical protein [Streptomyces humicola]MCQ4083951.1 hypothetical protein [Streptomyces humicola]